jgi:methyl-accepting chemotaxis protein
MFFAKPVANDDAAFKLDALDRSQAVIEFDLDGIILDANENFLKTMGYTLAEVKGKHHSMFAELGYVQSAAYKQFWEKLRRGEYDSGEYRRLGKSGKEVWIQASYNPIMDENSKPVRVVKFATDITQQKQCNADYQGQIAAISKAQAVIEFDLNGAILDANENFLAVMGYTLDEVKGKHHSMFAEPAYAQSPAYKQFWEKLRRGEFDAGEYKRIGKGGKEVWIQASYNPIMDMNGKPFKVVKYATDVTAQKLQGADYEGQLDAISKSQAVIEFNLDSTIITANNNFLHAMGYTLDEIKGKRHNIFVDPAEAQSDDYKQFWEKLRRGEYDSRVYKRIGKGGKEVWIQASYNPIMDMNGKPFKVVKFATEVTAVMRTADLADTTNENVQSVAAAVEEMSASVEEISKNMNLSRQATDEIMKKTQSSGAATEQLVGTMRSMENIVNLIRDIAGQVNLLALNATIEAARAGDAGKGFTVVASEVKNLANQAAKATDDIAHEISQVQATSEDVAASVRSIVDSADMLSQYVTSVATAIDEQTAVTREISGNTQKTSEAVGEIARRIKELSKAA